ncbi:hypothetical protein GN956_G19672 [Arapaima gigas]
MILVISTRRGICSKQVTEMISQLIFPACLILAAVSSASFTTAPPDGVTSKATNVTSVVPMFPISPNSTWNSSIPTTKAPSVLTSIYQNTTHNSSVLSESTLEPAVLTTTISAKTELTTALQPSTNTTVKSAGTVPGSTHGSLSTAITNNASDFPPHEYQTTGPNPGRNISAWTSISPYPTTQGAPSGMGYSEKSMTLFFSVLLGIVALVILMYLINRCKPKTQYSHHPLYNGSEETVDRFVAADDTLVISGGLYDGPRIYNPTNSTLNEDEEFHNDQPPFALRPTDFRLEFLNEDRENKSTDFETSTFKTFKSVEKDS